MKKRPIARLLSLALCLVLMTGLLAACGDSASTQPQSGSTGQSTNPGSSAPQTVKPLDITLFLWGDKPNQLDDVLNEFYNRTKDTLNMKLNINWTPQADYANNLQLKLSAGEGVDMCFDAPWMNMNTFILQGNYQDLTQYFLNDAYPGLAASFNEGLLSNNYMGENADQVYGIPLTQSFGGSNMIYIRADLREKYNLAPVTDLASFEAYLQAIVENEPNMIPFAMKKDGSYGAGGIFDAQESEKAIDKIEKGMWDVELAPGVTATLYIQDYKVVDCVITGEPSSSKAVLPAPYNQADYSTQLKIRAWYEKGYIEKDVITRDDAQAAFTSGLAASFLWDAAQFNSVSTALSGSVPTAKLENWVYDPLVTNNVEGMRKGSYTAWNFICIPVTTSAEKTERIMQFFDWMFSSSENHDLFELGIEGKNWKAVGDSEYGYPEGLDLATNYNLPGYELTWNPNYIRYPVGYPENVLALMKNTNNPDSYYDSLISGFRFNGDPVKNELANPDFLEAKTRRDTLLLGIYKDVAAENEKIDKEMQALTVMQEDIKTIKAEVVRQAEIYLEARKEKDAQTGIVYPTVAALKSQLP